MWSELVQTSTEILEYEMLQEMWPAVGTSFVKCDALRLSWYLYCGGSKVMRVPLHHPFYCRIVHYKPRTFGKHHLWKPLIYRGENSCLFIWGLDYLLSLGEERRQRYRDLREAFAGAEHWARLGVFFRRSVQCRTPKIEFSWDISGWTMVHDIWYL